MDQYKYSRLQGKEIRLVVLLPGDFDQDISIVIKTADLESHISSSHGPPPPETHGAPRAVKHPTAWLVRI